MLPLLLLLLDALRQHLFNVHGRHSDTLDVDEDNDNYNDDCDDDDDDTEALQSLLNYETSRQTDIRGALGEANAIVKSGISSRSCCCCFC